MGIYTTVGISFENELRLQQNDHLGYVPTPNPRGNSDRIAGWDRHARNIAWTLVIGVNGSNGYATEGGIGTTVSNHGEIFDFRCQSALAIGEDDLWKLVEKSIKDGTIGDVHAPTMVEPWGVACRLIPVDPDTARKLGIDRVSMTLPAGSQNDVTVEKAFLLTTEAYGRLVDSKVKGLVKPNTYFATKTGEAGGLNTVPLFEAIAAMQADPAAFEAEYANVNTGQTGIWLPTTPNNMTARNNGRTPGRELTYRIDTSRNAPSAQAASQPANRMMPGNRPAQNGTGNWRNLISNR